MKSLLEFQELDLCTDLSDAEAEAINGGGFFGDAWNWIKSHVGYNQGNPDLPDDGTNTQAITLRFDNSHNLLGGAAPTVGGGKTNKK
jgi:hypothetical protein